MSAHLPRTSADFVFVTCIRNDYDRWPDRLVAEGIFKAPAIPKAVALGESSRERATNLAAEKAMAAKEEVDGSLELSELIDAFMRLVEILYPKEQNPSTRFVKAMEKYVVPFLEDEDHYEELDEEEIQTANELIAENSPKLRRLFNHYANSGPEHEELSAAEFCTITKECDLVAMGISYSAAIRVFIWSNEQEIEDFLSGGIPSDALAVVMTMEFEEFEAALVMCAQIVHMRDKNSKKGIGGLLSDLIQHIFMRCPVVKLQLAIASSFS